MADDMARRALEEKKDVVFWNGKVPEDAPGNQVDEVYEQFDEAPALDWSKLPEPLKLEDPLTTAPAPPTVASVFGGMMNSLVTMLTISDSASAAMSRLEEVVSLDSDSCLATAAAAGSCEPASTLRPTPDPRLHPAVAAILEDSGPPVDDRPCVWCGKDSA